MPRTVTASSIMAKVRRRGDFENSGFITDAMLLDFIDSAWTELYDHLVVHFEDYYSQRATFDLEPDEPAYTLPGDFYKLSRVDLDIGSEDWDTLRPFTTLEENSHLYLLDEYPGQQLRYKLEGDSIRFSPTPTQADTIQMVYIPVADVIDDDEDSIDCVNGWDELLVLFVLRRCLVREESSVTAIDMEIARQMQRLDAVADSRDAGTPKRIQDVESRPWRRRR